MAVPKASRNDNFFTSAPISVGLAGVMILAYVVDSLMQGFSLYVLANFNYTQAVLDFEVWRWVTGIFVHPVGGSLFGSILFFVFIAPILERGVSRKLFIQFVVFGVLACYLGWVIISASGLLPSSEHYPLSAGIGIGASIAAGLFFRMGNQPVSLLIMNRPFLLKNVIGIYALVWFILVIGDASQYKVPVVSAAASLVVLCAILPGWLLSKQDPYGVSSGSKRKRKGKKKKKSSYEPKLKPKSNLNRSDSEVDKILDKISEDGFQSLTEKEKKVLEKASQNNGR